MQRIKVLVIGDVHLCDHPPGQRVEGYKDHILSKLYECVEIAAANEVTHVLFLGDIFHLKMANRVSHRLVQDTLKLMQSFSAPVTILVGNHDITDGTLDTLEKQPLGTVGFLPNVTLLTTDPVKLSDDVYIHPVSGVSGVTIDDFEIARYNKGDILAVHQSIVPDISKEREIIQEHLFDAKEVAERTDIDTILYGHQHRHDGVYSIERSNGTRALFSNLGSICRLSVTEEDLNKEPKVLILTINDDLERSTSTEVFELTNVIPASEAYRLEEHFEDKEKSRDIQETIDKLKQTEVTAFSIEGVISDVEFRPDIDDGVKKAALELLEAVR